MSSEPVSTATPQPGCLSVGCAPAEGSRGEAKRCSLSRPMPSWARSVQAPGLLSPVVPKGQGASPPQPARPGATQVGLGRPLPSLGQAAGGAQTRSRSPPFLPPPSPLPLPTQLKSSCGLWLGTWALPALAFCCVASLGPSSVSRAAERGQGLALAEPSAGQPAG